MSAAPPADPTAAPTTDNAIDPWSLVPVGSATGVGSLPGTSVLEATRWVRDLLPEFPHLPELPARGPGADLVGRTMGVVGSVTDDLAVQTTPDGWRLASRPGRDHRHALALMGEDLDALQEVFEGLTGVVKVQLAGPWTLAAGVELATGARVLSDPGAVRDLAGALAAAAAGHVAEVRRRLPGASVLVQFDEPSLPAVLEGSVPTASGWSRHNPVEPPVAGAALERVLDGARRAGAGVLLHCCAARPPYELFEQLPAVGWSLDLTHHQQRDDDVLAGAVESGRPLVLGVLDPLDRPPPHDPVSGRPVRGGEAALARSLVRWWARLGFTTRAPAGITLSPACGLAGVRPEVARWTLETLRAAAAALIEEVAQS